MAVRPGRPEAIDRGPHVEEHVGCDGEEALVALGDAVVGVEGVLAEAQAQGHARVTVAHGRGQRGDGVPVIVHAQPAQGRRGRAHLVDKGGVTDGRGRESDEHRSQGPLGRGPARHVHRSHLGQGAAKGVACDEHAPPGGQRLVEHLVHVCAHGVECLEKSSVAVRPASTAGRQRIEVGKEVAQLLGAPEGHGDEAVARRPRGGLWDLPAEAPEDPARHRVLELEPGWHPGRPPGQCTAHSGRDDGARLVATRAVAEHGQAAGLQNRKGVSQGAVHEPRAPRARVAHGDSVRGGGEVVRCEGQEESALEQRRVVEVALVGALQRRGHPLCGHGQERSTGPGHLARHHGRSRVIGVADHRPGLALHAGELICHLCAQLLLLTPRGLEALRGGRLRTRGRGGRRGCWRTRRRGLQRVVHGNSNAGKSTV
mmetsp:Transcript_24223/g.75524  ORF Transcript_24223/g.75524 Transcript_24223/m.75524 type:complete len:427 (-) Transcript_24223:214-1494(-)